MAKILFAVHLIDAGKVQHQPGKPFYADDDEAADLIKLGAAREPADQDEAAFAESQLGDAKPAKAAKTGKAVAPKTGDDL